MSMKRKLPAISALSKHKLSGFIYRRHRSRSAVWKGRSVETLEELSKNRKTRVLQHWWPEGKESGERKRLVSKPLRSGTNCVQPDLLSFCFKSNTGGTAEEWGGACIALSEHYDVILDMNWSYSVVGFYLLDFFTGWLCYSSAVGNVVSNFSSFHQTDNVSRWTSNVY